MWASGIWTPCHPKIQMSIWVAGKGNTRQRDNSKLTLLREPRKGWALAEKTLQPCIHKPRLTQLPPKQVGSVLPGGSTTPHCIQTQGQALFGGSEPTVSLCVLLLLFYSSSSAGCLHSNASLDLTRGFYSHYLAQAASQYPAISLSNFPAVSNNALV